MKMKNDLTFKELRLANMLRDKQWDPEDRVTLWFRALELGGETGEALNIVKKIVREAIGIRGSRSTTAQLAEELADIVICVDLLAMELNIELNKTIIEKFDKTSRAQGLDTFIDPDHDPRTIPNDSDL